MTTSAKLSNTRIAPRKIRLVAAQIRGLPVEDALNLLVYSNKKAATLIKKVVESAVANAAHNDGADIDALKVSEVLVDAGPTTKRLRARARGRADRIIKRTSHIKVTVSEAAGN